MGAPLGFAETIGEAARQYGHADACEPRSEANQGHNPSHNGLPAAPPSE
jgi:hypothetical protein